MTLCRMLLLCVGVVALLVFAGCEDKEVSPSPAQGAGPVSYQQEPLRYDPRGPDRDCGDFATQSEATAFYLAAGGPAIDPHRLDRDGDGVACEALP